VHLKDLHSVLHSVLKHNPIEVKEEGRPLINFQRYVKFMDKIKGILHYKPPALEQYRQQGYLAYLENQLQCVCIGENIDGELMKKSIELQEREVLEIYSSLGFKTKP
jgi:son of sevenless-like protein